MRHRGPVALDRLTELEIGFGARQQLGKTVAPVLKPIRAQILAVEVEQVEGEKHQPVRLALHRLAQFAECGNAPLVLNRNLAVDYR